MAADWTTYLLMQMTPGNLKLASIVFVVAFLFVKAAYKTGLVDEHAIQQDKERKGTLAIGTILFILGVLAMLILFVWINQPRMVSVLGRAPHLMYMLVISSVVIFGYIVDFFKNMIIIFDVDESGGQKFMHLIVDLVNTVYGLCFAFFAVPVLYYLILHLTTPT